jgi:hypothetical protein
MSGAILTAVPMFEIQSPDWIAVTREPLPAFGALIARLCFLWASPYSHTQACEGECSMSTV